MNLVRCNYKIIFFSLMLFGISVHAQEYPERALKWIVPFAPGSAADTTSRYLASKLAERLKQPVVIDNKPGAGAAIGVTALKRAAPDGYTIGNLVSANVVQPWLVKESPFDIRKDFQSVALMYSGPMVLTVQNSSPLKNLSDLIEYVKSNPNKAFIGSIGAGSATYLAAELLKQMAGVTLINVNFKDAIEMHRAVSSGELLASFDTYASPRPLIEGGRLKVLAVTSKDRMSRLPQIPAIAEYFPGYDISSWTGIGLPVGTPKEITEKLTREIRYIMQTPNWRQLIESNGVEVSQLTSAEFSQRIASDFEKFGRLIQSSNIKIE